MAWFRRISGLLKVIHRESTERELRFGFGACKIKDMAMAKKIGILIFILILAGAGFFYWQNQQDVRELNKTLPEGVKVVKSLFGQEYKVVNKIDGYEFKVPKEWKGVKEIDYIPERTESGYTGTSINIIGLKEGATSIGVDRFRVEGEVILQNWAQDMFNKVGLMGNFSLKKVGSFDIVMTQENIHLGGMFMYFVKKSDSIYTFTSPSEEFIREIITNGKW